MSEIQKVPVAGNVDAKLLSGAVVMNKLVEQPSDELVDDELETVSGGKTAGRTSRA